MLVGNKKDREEDKRQDEIEKEAEEQTREHEPITDWEIDMALDMVEKISNGEQPLEQIDEKIYPEEWDGRGDDDVATIVDSIFDQRHPERNSAILTEEDNEVGEWLVLQKGVAKLKAEDWQKPPPDNTLPGHREVSTDEAKAYADSRGSLFYETSPKIDSDINRNRTKNTVTGVYTVHSTVKEAANLLIDQLMAAYQADPSVYDKPEEDEYQPGEEYAEQEGENQEAYY